MGKRRLRKERRGSSMPDRFLHGEDGAAVGIDEDAEAVPCPPSPSPSPLLQLVTKKALALFDQSNTQAANRISTGSGSAPMQERRMTQGLTDGRISTGNNACVDQT
jgi:hypothetical protein